MTTGKKTTKKLDIEQELDEAKQELRRVREEKEAMAAGSSIGSPKMVPVRNYGGTMLFVPYDINGVHRTAIFQADGPKASGAIPYDVWINIEHDNVVTQGYLARTDLPITNHNIIEDIEDFFSSSSDKEIKAKVSKIDNKNILYKCFSYLHEIPKADRDGKLLVALDAVISRIEEVANISLTEEDLG